MKLRCVYSILLSCLLLALPVISVTSYSQSQDAITESKVLAIVDAVDKAARKGNVAGIVAHLAKDVKIKMVVINPVSGTRRNSISLKSSIRSIRDEDFVRDSGTNLNEGTRG